MNIKDDFKQFFIELMIDYDFGLTNEDEDKLFNWIEEKFSQSNQEIEEEMFDRVLELEIMKEEKYCGFPTIESEFYEFPIKDKEIRTRNIFRKDFKNKIEELNEF